MNQNEKKLIKAELVRELLEVLIKAEEHLDYCGYGDSWERECAKEEKLPQLINSTIAKFQDLLNNSNSNLN